MKLNRNSLGSLSRSIVGALVEAGNIETEAPKDVERDLESVLSGYLNQLDQVLSRARDLVQQRGLPQGEYGRLKRLCADQAGIKVDEEALDYILDQLVNMLLHSDNVEEVFAADHELKRRMRPFLREEDEA